MCLPLMLLWFQWLLWIKAHLIAHWVCKPPEVCPPKELTISYYFLNIKHTMTLTARDYTSSVYKELWLLKMEEILVEFAHNCFSLQLVCSRPYFPLCQQRILCLDVPGINIMWRTWDIFITTVTDTCLTTCFLTTRLPGNKKNYHLPVIGGDEPHKI